MKALLQLTTLVAMTTACIATVSAAQGPALRLGIAQPSYRSGNQWEPSFEQERVQRNQWKKGALIGAGVAAAVVGIVTVYMQLLTREEDISPMFFVGPVLIGALVGGMIGSGSHPHRREFK